MAAKRVSKERSDQVKRELIEWIQAGNTDMPDHFRKRFSDIDRITLWRWMDKARIVAGSTALAAAEARTKKAAAAVAAKPAVAAHLVGNQMPKPVTPDSISSLGNVTAIEMVHECIDHARQVLVYCKTEDGKIRNYKGFLSASGHMRSSIDTLARVVERMNDAAKINQIQAAMMAEIRAASPEVAERIIQRIEAIVAEWGY